MRENAGQLADAEAADGGAVYARLVAEHACFVCEAQRRTPQLKLRLPQKKAEDLDPGGPRRSRKQTLALATGKTPFGPKRALLPSQSLGTAGRSHTAGLVSLPVQRMREKECVEPTWARHARPHAGSSCALYAH